MIISFCIPCMNRTADLKKAMPHVIKAANASPPVEIMVLNYDSRDDLQEYIKLVMETKPMVEGNILSYTKYTGQGYYHIAHAWNLAVKASIGEYVVIMGADAMPVENFLVVIRDLLAKHNYTWMHGKKLRGITVCKKKEFIDAGGYDERFEFYGGEDKDLSSRLHRRKASFGKIPPDLLSVVKTPNSEKLKNYRSNMTKVEMMLHNKAIRNENSKNEVLVANKGKKWGQWTR